MSKKTFFINSIFFIAIILSIIYIKQFMDTSIGEKKKNSPPTPDAYMIDASYISTNENGQREIVLFSPYVTHYQQQDTSYFQKPDIVVYKKEEIWRISSERAKAIKGASTFYLFDHVKVKQIPNTKGDGTILTTQSLTVFPKKNVVTTNDFVTIEQSGLKINAIGLRGDLDKGNIQLLSRTRGQYDPKKTN